MQFRSGLALSLGLAALATPVPAEESARPDGRAHGLAMHGDLKYPAGVEHFDYTNPDAPKGGTLRRAAIGTYDSFNPFILNGSSAAGLAFLGNSLLYDSLLTGSADAPFSEYGLLAESVETPADRSWVEFVLREDARWHDGKPITTDDVIWSFETLLAKGTPFYRFYFGSVKHVEKTGPRKVKFTFEAGDNRELPLILGQLPVLPRHYWSTRDCDTTTLEPPLGSGPYAIDAFEAGRYVSYKRRADYWGRDLPVNKGSYNFDVIHFDYYRDADVAIEALKGGAFDFRAENNSKKWATAYDTPDVRAKRLRMELVPNDRNQGTQGFIYNLRRSYFQDRRVRRALSYAFDFEWSNKTLFYGQYTRTRSYFQNSALAAEGLPSAAELAILEPYREQIPEEVFTSVFEPPSTDGSGNNRANLRTAATLLKEAGWSINDGKLIHGETGEGLAFEILLVSPAFERVALPFVKNLARIGVTATVRTVDSAQYRRRADDFDFDMLIQAIGQSESPGNEQRDYWTSTAASQKGGRNLIGIRDPVIDALVELVISAPDRARLVDRTRALDRVLQWGYYLIPQHHISAERLVYWDRFGRPAVSPPSGTVLMSWWIDEERDAALQQRRTPGKGGS